MAEFPSALWHAAHDFPLKTTSPFAMSGFDLAETLSIDAGAAGSAANENLKRVHRG